MSFNLVLSGGFLVTASPIPNNTGQKTKILLITSVINKNNKFSFWRKNNKEVAEGMLVVAPNQALHGFG